MAVTINAPKFFSVKFTKADGFMTEIETVEAVGRSGAREIIAAKYLGCIILDSWQDGSIRTR